MKLLTMKELMTWLSIATAQVATGNNSQSSTELAAHRPLEARRDDEPALVARVRAGDTRAFGILVERYMRRGYAMALGLIGSPEDARDLSQDAFVRAFQARQTLDATRPFYPWYYQILRRLCFNFTRDSKLHRDKLDQQASWLALDADARAPARPPDEEARLEELRQRLASAIASLPDHERETFVLREYEALRYREIAELLEIPQGTVMSRLYSARRRLAGQLEDLR